MYGWVFLALLIVLFIASRLTSQAITDLFRKVVRSHGVSIKLLAIVLLPGVIVHEVAHAVMAMLLFVPVGKMEFMPEVDGEHVKLGSVQVGKTDPVRRMLIGIAPVIAGLAIIFSGLYLLAPREVGEVFARPWQTALLLYGLFAVGNTMFSSRKDLEGTIGFVVAVIVVGGILFLAGLRIPESVLVYFATDSTQQLFQTGSIFLAVPLLINGVVVVFVRVLLGIR